MKNLNRLLQKHFEENMQHLKLFRVALIGKEIWELYINSFFPEHNPKFRDPTSSDKNCNHCKNFIRRYGNIVAIDSNNNLISLFDIDNCPEVYQASLNVMSKEIKKSKVENVFFETFNELNSLPYEKCKKDQKTFRLGIDSNVKRYTKEEAEIYGIVKPDEIKTFHHFYLNISNKFVDHSGKSVEAILGEYKSAFDVFKRGMETISLDTLLLVKDLINQGSLLDATSHLSKIESLIPLKKEYDELSKKDKDNWCWVTSYQFTLAKFRNSLIGVLCSELSEGMELNKACLNWNKRVDPSNYMKATAPITKRQIEEAKKFVEENGYEDSFDRRPATLTDIKASEILHLNNGDGKVKKASIFDKVKSTSTRHKKAEFDKVEEVSIDNFMEKILPTVTSLEVYLETRMEGNLMSLTKSVKDESKPLFKYSNNYSQTFNGNLAGKSEIRDNVSKVGGNIKALVRASLQWNDKDTPGIVDFDLHSIGQNHIFHGSKGRIHSCGGHLDVDMIRPSKIGIENITWKNKIEDGVYKISVKNYCGRSNKGFKIEIEIPNETFNYHCTKSLARKEPINIATLKVKNGAVSIEHHLPETNSSKEIYKLESNKFHKVNLMCLSPNHWGENKIGNKYFLFLLEKCKFTSSIRSFHIVDMLTELQKHRKVLEVLGNTQMIEPIEGKQLSGIGFNSTVKDELIVRVQGTHKRVLKIKF